MVDLDRPALAAAAEAGHNTIEPATVSFQGWSAGGVHYRRRAAFSGPPVIHGDHGRSCYRVVRHGHHLWFDGVGRLHLDEIRAGDLGEKPANTLLGDVDPATAIPRGT
jgi:hypothetical protein